MTFTAEYLIAFVTGWTLPFFRIAAAVTTSPVLGNRAVPVRIKAGVAIVLTLAIAPLLPDLPQVDPTSTSTVLLVMREVLIGLAFGFALRLALFVLEFAGQLIAHLMGLGFAAMVDPQTGIDVPVLSQFYIILATFVFLGLDGHLILVSTLAESFRVLPVGLPSLNFTSLWEMVNQAGWAFGAALQLALPAVGAAVTNMVTSESISDRLDEGWTRSFAGLVDCLGHHFMHLQHIGSLGLHALDADTGGPLDDVFDARNRAHGSVLAVLIVLTQVDDG